MSIHQITVHYRADADRLLVLVRSRSDELYTLWLTRRLALRMWPHLLAAVERMSLARWAPHATPQPEAREMLARSAKEELVRRADFATPMDPRPAQQPLGPEPMLLTEVMLSSPRADLLALRLLDGQGRHVDMQLGAQLAVALVELMSRALRQADWGVALDDAQPAPAAERATRRAALLN